MSDTRFTASNGLYVENGQVYLPDGTRANADLSSVRAVVLIEYGAHQAQAERDAELGRWRSVDHPDWVVYLADNGLARVVNELTGLPETLLHKRPGSSSDTSVGASVAREYFAAHPVPEPKPWEQAKPHEVWVLTFLSGLECAATYVNGKFRYGTGSAMVMENVIAGKCIWKPGVSA